MSRPVDHADGAQIDLLLDRADGIISICEAKFAESEFVVDKAYAGELRRKLDAFRARAPARKSLQLVLVTNGVRPGLHSTALIDRVVTAEALFSS